MSSILLHFKFYGFVFAVFFRSLRKKQPMATLAQLIPISAPSRSQLVQVEQERQRIARDLHDSIGGMLSTALLLFDGVDAQNQERFLKV